MCVEVEDRWELSNGDVRRLWLATVNGEGMDVGGDDAVEVSGWRDYM